MDEVPDPRMKSRYKATMRHVMAATGTIVTAVILLLAVVAVVDAREALRSSQRNEHNLCLAVKGINRHDRETIKKGPADAAKLLRVLGFNEQTIARFVVEQQPIANREAHKRPDLVCERGVRFVPPP